MITKTKLELSQDESIHTVPFATIELFLDAIIAPLLRVVFAFEQSVSMKHDLRIGRDVMAKFNQLP